MLCFLKIIQRHSAKYVKRHRSDHFSRCCEMPHYVSGMQTDSKEFVAKENSRPLRIFSGYHMRARSAERARLEPFTIVQQEDGGPAGSAFDHTESFSKV